MNDYNVYNDIKARTNGEIYIGVVGPVRRGKSTFIKRFMELIVLPGIKDENNKKLAIDEMPQSANGKIIMTTEPKFIPKEAVSVEVDNAVNMKVRLVDCVGYMVEGALGHEEGEKERMVKTPWFDSDIPFTQAAKIGTKKVITDHSTIGIVITTDGSIGEIPRDSYVEAEKTTIEDMKANSKPFVVILNSTRPYASETIALASQMEEEYGVKVIPLSCLNMKKSDIDMIIREIVVMFPIEQINFNVPKWVETLDEDSAIKQDIINKVRMIMGAISTINDANTYNYRELIESSTGVDKDDDTYISDVRLEGINMETGIVNMSFDVYEQYYYKMLSDLTGVEIDSQYGLIDTLKYLASKKAEFERVSEAYEEVKTKGYGVVTPDISDISLMEPELIKHGNNFGIKIKAKAPSMHLLKADITTEIAPIVGSESQARDLITYLESGTEDNPEGIWDTNIFGKSIRQLVDEGIHTKVNNMTEDTRVKMQETLAKLLNDSKGGVICIII